MPVVATLTPEMAALVAPLREVAAGILHAAATPPVHRLRRVRLGQGVLVCFWVRGFGAGEFGGEWHGGLTVVDVMFRSRL